MTDNPYNPEERLVGVSVGNDRFRILGLAESFPNWYPVGEPGVYHDILHLTHLPLVAGQVDVERRVAESSPPNDCDVPACAGHHLPTSPKQWWDELRDYQRDAITTMRSRKASLLADDLGLGKTRTALGAATPPVLIVAPKSAVRSVWGVECHRRGWNYQVLEGTKITDETLECIKLGVDREGQAVNAWITSYSVFHRWAPWFGLLAPGKCHTLIGDEIHYLQKKKVRMAQAWRAVDAQRRIGITATPIRNRLQSLWAILDALSPKVWGSYYDFAMAYCGAREGAYGLEFGEPTPQDLERLIKRLSAVLVRRTAKEVGLEIPSLTRKTIPVSIPSDTIEQVTREIREEVTTRAYKGNLHASRQLAYWTTWRERTACLKAEATVDHVLGLLPEWGRVVIWIWHTTLARDLARRFEAEGVTCDQIVGSTLGSAREKILIDWKDGDPHESRVLIASMGACSAAVAFTAAGVEVFAELDYAPLQVNQAEKRTHRWGQRHGRCEAHYLVIPGTPDEMIATTLVEKAQEIEQVIGDKAQADQMRQLLGFEEQKPDESFLEKIYKDW
jgi:SWI/SNF-related matrix-associated actin-dependent regulator of chromatin subfamily A-like protein 1